MSRDNEKPAPRLPEIGEFVPSVGICEGVVEIPTPPQPPPIKAYSFLDVAWEVVVRGGADHEKSIVGLSDFYRPGSGRDEALAEARAFCLAEEVRPDGQREVVVVKVTTRRLRIPTRQTGTSWEDGCVYGGYKFRNFDECRAPHVPQDEELSREVAWSSRKPEEKP